MGNELRYPSILQAGKLKELNEYVISQLGTPVFFVTPEPSRPHSEDPCGRVYEIITGLYIVYKDYGIRFLSAFLSFCKKHFSMYGRYAYAHYDGIATLRGGVCHGGMPHGKHVQELMCSLDFYFPGANAQWPGMLPGMTKEQCVYFVNRLSDDSDKMVNYIKMCADRIAQDETLCKLWKQVLLTEVMNKSKEQYSNGKSFFDERVVQDLAKACRGSDSWKPHKPTICQWIAKMEPVIQSGGIKQSDELYKSLYDSLYSLYHPQVSQVATSSAELLLSEFDI